MSRRVRTTFAVKPPHLTTLGTDELRAVAPGLHAFSIKVVQMSVLTFEMATGTADYRIHLNAS